MAAKGQVLSGVEVHIVGVIAGRRDFSKKLVFLELSQDPESGSERMQVVLNHKVRSQTWAEPDLDGNRTKAECRNIESLPVPSPAPPRITNTLMQRLLVDRFAVAPWGRVLDSQFCVQRRG